ncbi:permease [Salmonella enterica subsp. enterica]|nr:permease [Salmonella enterica subsp. enterica] [Salmonella enterica subsp. enterica serovar Menston]
MKNNIEETIGKYLPILMILPLAGLAELASLYSIQALLPKLSEVYNIPLNQVGMILSAEVGFLALAMLFSGTLSDRFGRKPIIFYSLLAGGILTLLCATASSWPMLVVYRALLGIAVSGITAAVTVYISEEVSPALAGIVTGYFIFGNSLGSMSGRVFATLMMEACIYRYDFLYLRWCSDCYGTRGEVVSPDIPTVCSYTFTTAWCSVERRVGTF